MNISEACYEAAIKMNDLEYVDGSCLVLDQISHEARLAYVDLFSPTGNWYFSDQTEVAAKSAKWATQDYRTFMLLMASEALK